MNRSDKNPGQVARGHRWKYCAAAGLEPTRGRRGRHGLWPRKTGSTQSSWAPGEEHHGQRQQAAGPGGGSGAEGAGRPRRRGTRGGGARWTREASSVLEARRPARQQWRAEVNRAGVRETGTGGGARGWQRLGTAAVEQPNRAEGHGAERRRLGADLDGSKQWSGAGSGRREEPGRAGAAESSGGSWAPDPVAHGPGDARRQPGATDLVLRTTDPGLSSQGDKARAPGLG